MVWGFLRLARPLVDDATQGATPACLAQAGRSPSARPIAFGARLHAAKGGEGPCRAGDLAAVGSAIFRLWRGRRNIHQSAPPTVPTALRASPTAIPPACLTQRRGALPSAFSAQFHAAERREGPYRAGDRGRRHWRRRLPSLSSVAAHRELEEAALQAVH